MLMFECAIMYLIYKILQLSIAVDGTWSTSIPDKHS